jgi:hypothetical protein
MNAEIKARWIAALLSGEYEQAVGALRTADGYCCLGVLCDLHAKETQSRWRGSCYKDQEATLPRAVVKWAGLPSANPEVKIDGENKELAVLNDEEMDFAEIATQAIPQL